MYQRKIGGIISNFPKSTREKIAHWLLNWAEKQKVTKVSNWFLFQLQEHQQLQRGIADITYKQSRPLKGTEIEFIGFRLFEIFHYEDFDKIRIGLRNMFPDLDSRGSDFLEGFEKTSEAMNTGVWHPIGTLYRDSPRFMGGGKSFRQFSTIHDAIKLIDVDVQKILPSTFIVSFDVQLNESATNQLRELQNRKYLGESLFAGINFGKFPSIDMVTSSPDKIMIASIRNWISSLRENVELIVKPYLNGYFLSKHSQTRHLPSIEVYSLSRALPDQKNFSHWVNLDRTWGHSLSLNLSSHNLYGNEKLIFSWRNSASHSGFCDANKVIFFSEKFSKQASSIWQDAKYLFIESTSLIAIIEYLDDSQKALEKMRRQIFNAIGKAYGLSQYVQLYQTFQALSRTLQRLNLEIEHKMLFFGSKNFYDLADLLEIQFRKVRGKSQTNKLDTLVLAGQKRMQFLNMILLGHITFIDKTFSTHIEFLNISAVYRLQKLTFWLTIIATIIAILSVLLNLSELIKLLDNIKITLTSYFFK